MSEIKSLARGLTVLKIMAEVDQSIGITNLADKLGVNKSTVSRMVQTLMNHGFVELSKNRPMDAAINWVQHWSSSAGWLSIGLNYGKLLILS